MILDSRCFEWLDEIIPGCPEGTYVYNNKCHHCPVGTYWENGYRDDHCVSCPDGMTTDYVGAAGYYACRSKFISF